MNLQLSVEEAKLLVTHLGRHVEHLDRELVRTDKRELQHALAQEIETLQAIVARIEGLG